MSLDLAATVAAIRAVVGPRPGPVGLHEPWLAGREWEYVKSCLDEGWISSVGAFVDRFENDLAAYCGTARAVATVNGTAALHTALMVLGVKPGDEVLVPALTFVATANAVAHCGAVPHFVDSAPDTLGLCPERLRDHLERLAVRGPNGPVNRHTGRRLAAVVPVHVFGHPVAADPLAEVAAHFELPIIEDATEALGSLYHGRPAGGLGRIGVFSFNGNKILTTGGGGMLVTDDASLADAARHLTTTAKRPHPWAFEHDAVAYNYRLPNVNAAIGCAQLERLPLMIARKRRLAEAYRQALAELPGLEVVPEPAGSRSNFWLNAVRLKADQAARRDELLAATHAAGLMTRPAWTPMSHLPMYADCPRADLTVTEDLVRRLVCLPSSAWLGAEDGPEGGR
ncbi:LegC family aminotransferase [Roseospirillum parvum]|uniref:GDP-perosamine synthase n=1 Tax=Roseospirillum parvum TaxID=83401 RepID=A0A1G7V2L9_9PROT|nr:LegC family aminotransferase [Roseospirillum parvum]SDG53210.1 perosamine synthetase [Roseospirillum parvum]